MVSGGIERGEEEAGGAIKEHDNIAAGGVEGEGAVEDNALGVKVGSDIGGGEAKGIGWMMRCWMEGWMMR